MSQVLGVFFLIEGQGKKKDGSKGRGSRGKGEWVDWYHTGVLDVLWGVWWIWDRWSTYMHTSMRGLGWKEPGLE